MAETYQEKLDRWAREAKVQNAPPEEPGLLGVSKAYADSLPVEKRSAYEEKKARWAKEAGAKLEGQESGTAWTSRLAKYLGEKAEDLGKTPFWQEGPLKPVLEPIRKTLEVGGKMVPEMEGKPIGERIGIALKHAVPAEGAIVKQQVGELARPLYAEGEALKAVTEGKSTKEVALAAKEGWEKAEGTTPGTIIQQGLQFGIEELSARNLPKPLQTFAKIVSMPGTMATGLAVDVLLDPVTWLYGPAEKAIGVGRALAKRMGQRFIAPETVVNDVRRELASQGFDREIAERLVKEGVPEIQAKAVAAARLEEAVQKEVPAVVEQRTKLLAASGGLPPEMAKRGIKPEQMTEALQRELAYRNYVEEQKALALAGKEAEAANKAAAVRKKLGIPATAEVPPAIPGSKPGAAGTPLETPVVEATTEAQKRAVADQTREEFGEAAGMKMHEHIQRSEDLQAAEKQLRTGEAAPRVEPYDPDVEAFRAMGFDEETALAKARHARSEAEHAEKAGRSQVVQLRTRAGVQKFKEDGLLARAKAGEDVTAELAALKDEQLATLRDLESASRLRIHRLESKGDALSIAEEMAGSTPQSAEAKATTLAMQEETSKELAVVRKQLDEALAEKAKIHGKYRELEAKVMVDQGSGLPSGMAFETKKPELDAAGGHYMFFDINRGHDLDVQLGHQGMDDLIAQVGKDLKEEAEEQGWNFAARRYATGDEFVGHLVGDAEAGRQKAQSVLSRIANKKYTVIGKGGKPETVKVSLTAGVGNTERSADEAMFAMKQAGRRGEVGTSEYVAEQTARDVADALDALGVKTGQEAPTGPLAGKEGEVALGAGGEAPGGLRNAQQGAGEVKASYQMTRDEVTDRLFPRGAGYGPKGRQIEAAWLNKHKQDVEKAIAEGKTIPPEVLADYPDLALKAQGELVGAGARGTGPGGLGEGGFVSIGRPTNLVTVDTQDWATFKNALSSRKVQVTPAELELLQKVDQRSGSVWLSTKEMNILEKIRAQYSLPTDLLPSVTQVKAGVQVSRAGKGAATVSPQFSRELGIGGLAKQGKASLKLPASDLVNFYQRAAPLATKWEEGFLNNLMERTGAVGLTRKELAVMERVGEKAGVAAPRMVGKGTEGVLVQDLATGERHILPKTLLGRKAPFKAREIEIGGSRFGAPTRVYAMDTKEMDRLITNFTARGGLSDWETEFLHSLDLGAGPRKAVMKAGKPELVAKTHLTEDQLITLQDMAQRHSLKVAVPKSSKEGRIITNVVTGERRFADKKYADTAVKAAQQRQKALEWQALHPGEKLKRAERASRSENWEKQEKVKEFAQKAEAGTTTPKDMAEAVGVDVESTAKELEDRFNLVAAKPASTLTQEEREFLANMKEPGYLKGRGLAIPKMRSPDLVLEGSPGLKERVYYPLKEGLVNKAFADRINAERIKGWIGRVGDDAETSRKIFRYLDGTHIASKDGFLTREELAVAGEMRSYLDGVADLLNLPHERRVSNYITHLFDEAATKRMGIPEELYALIDFGAQGRAAKATTKRLLENGVPEIRKELGRAGVLEHAGEWELKAYGRPLTDAELASMPTANAAKMRGAGHGSLNEEQAVKAIDYLKGDEAALSTIPEASREPMQRAKQVIDEIAGASGLDAETIRKSLGDFLLTGEDMIPARILEAIEHNLPREVRMPFMLQRTGATGYLEDVWKALDSYSRTATKRVHLDPALQSVRQVLPQLNLTTRKFVQEMTFRALGRRPVGLDVGLQPLVNGAADKMDLLFSRIAGKPVAFTRPAVRTLLHEISRASYAGLLSGPGTALKNLGQQVNTVAEIGPKWWMEGVRQLGTSEGRGIIKANGVFDTKMIDYLTTATARTKTMNALHKTQDAFVAGFNGVEYLNKSTAFLGARAKALAEGKTMPEALRYARDTMRRTQFEYSAIDTPLAFQTPLGRLFGQFGTYPVKQSEFLIGLVKRAKAGERAPLLRYIASTMAVMYLGNEVLGLDFDNIFGLGIGVRKKDVWLPIANRKYELPTLALTGQGILPSGLAPIPRTAQLIAQGKIPQALGQITLQTAPGSMFFKKAGELGQTLAAGGKVYNTKGELVTTQTPLQSGARFLALWPSEQAKHRNVKERYFAEKKRDADRMKDILTQYTKGNFKEAVRLSKAYKLWPSQASIETAIKKRYVPENVRLLEGMPPELVGEYGPEMAKAGSGFWTGPLTGPEKSGAGKR